MRVDKILPLNISENAVQIDYHISDIVKIVEYFEENEPTDPKLLPTEISALLLKCSVNEDNFLNWVAGLFGKIKPVYENKQIDVIKTLSTSNFSNIEYRDRVYNSSEIVALFKFFREINWSFFTRTAQTKAKHFNSAVPMFLYAQRLYNSIPYNDFKVNNVSVYPTLLGKAFKGMPAPSNNYNHFDFLRLRVEMMTGKKGGVPHIYPFNSYKCNKTSDAEFNEIPKLLRMMLGQIWIFNGQCRNKNMILDWNNWDNIPVALDGSTENATADSGLEF